MAGATVHFTVQSLGVDGALLVGQSRLRIGQRLELELSLPHTTARVSCVVVRLELRHHALCPVVRFEELSAQTELHIHNTVLSAISRARPRSERTVMVIASLEASAERLRKTVARLGFKTLWARTFLDALGLLQSNEQCVDVVMSEAQVGADSGADLLAWCADALPHMRRVLVVPPDVVHRLPASRERHYNTLVHPVSLAEVSRVLDCPLRSPLPSLRPPVRATMSSMPPA